MGIECPHCHFRQFMEVDSDLMNTFQDSKVVRKIYAELQAWMVSRCPEHLRAIAGMAKN
jgi:DNA-directed RNA polymerase subunit RPC12/RpoP